MPSPASFLQRFKKRISPPAPLEHKDGWAAAQDFTASLTSGSAHTAALPERGAAAPASFLAPQAAALAARLPDLMLQANRIAATLYAGQHGQHRAGGGENFWQYRQAQPGEPVQHIDWRQSARSTHAYVRETEAQAPQTYLLWCDLTPSMHWHSAPNLPDKNERAILLQLAIAAYLLRKGERVRLLTPTGLATPPPAGTPLERLALALLDTAQKTPTATALPSAAFVPRYTQLIIASDFLCDPHSVHATLRHLAGAPARAHLLHISDPAELTLPYQGHVMFEGLEQEPQLDLPHVQSLRQAYETEIAAHTAALQASAAQFGHTLTQHCTHDAPLPTLLTLQSKLSMHGHFQ